MSALAPVDQSAVSRACSRCGATNCEVQDSARGPLCLSCYLLATSTTPRAREPKRRKRVNLPSQPVRLSGPRLTPYGSQAPVLEPPDTVARIRALGIEGRLLRRFPCVLPGHDHDARVHPTDAGYWQYTCRGEPNGFGLAEVRARLAYGAARRISDLEAARWRERLDHEAGLLDRDPVSLPVPDGAPRSAVRVAGGISLLVGLRDPDRWPEDEPFAFARTFAAAWCGIGPKAVRVGLAYLEAVGLIERAGAVETAGPRRAAILWRLTPQSAGQRKSPEDRSPTGADPFDENALVAGLIEAFDAEEVTGTQSVQKGAA